MWREDRSIGVTCSCPYACLGSRSSQEYLRVHMYLRTGTSCSASASPLVRHNMRTKSALFNAPTTSRASGGEACAQVNTSSSRSACEALAAHALVMAGTSSDPSLRARTDLVDKSTMTKSPSFVAFQIARIYPQRTEGCHRVPFIVVASDDLQVRPGLAAIEFSDFASALAEAARSDRECRKAVRSGDRPPEVPLRFCQLSQADLSAVEDACFRDSDFVSFHYLPKGGTSILVRGGRILNACIQPSERVDQEMILVVLNDRLSSGGSTVKQGVTEVAPSSSPWLDGSAGKASTLFASLMSSSLRIFAARSVTHRPPGQGSSFRSTALADRHPTTSIVSPCPPRRMSPRPSLNGEEYLLWSRGSSQGKMNLSHNGARRVPSSGSARW